MKYILKYEIDKGNIKNDILIKRGVNFPEKYLSVGKESQNNPFLLNNMNKGCALLIKHLSAGNKIYLQPDSDLDGIMSSAMLYNYIKLVWPDANIVYKMHQGKQHGIILDYIPEDTDLAIFPDAATNNVKEQKALKERGIDVLIIDHHEISYNITDAILINNQDYNPETQDFYYPNKSLSGGGVVFKFLEALDSILSIDFSQQFIDMAAISIIGDMMDLRDYENRYIVKKGLQNITNLGLKTIIEVQSFSIYGEKRTYEEGGPITPESVSWYIVPLVNALIRVGTQTEKELLFMAFTEGNKIVPSTKRGGKGLMESVASQAIRNCVNARSRQNRAKEKAIDELDFKIQKNELFRNQVIFVNVEDSEMFDSTLTGLIAMNILSKYKKPTIVARLGDDDCWKGSARGSSATELKDLKSFFAESKMFEFVEGHANAFGLSIHSENVEKLINYSNEKLKDIEFNENVYEVDLIYSAKDNLKKAIEDIDSLKDVWGQGIEKPLIVVEQIKLFPEDVSFIGANKNTIKFKNNGVSYLKFKDDEFIEKIRNLKNGFSITVLGKASINNYNGYSDPQIMIDDYIIRDTSLDF